jgi:hypothetical protein
MTTEIIAPPYLTAAEIDDLCEPLTQRHAQTRHLCQLLRVDSLPRRPDGLPLVGRKLAEERLNSTGEYIASAGFNWSR